MEAITKQMAEELGIPLEEIKKATQLVAEKYYPDSGRYYLLPNGKRIYISDIDMSFVIQLRKLPTATKCKILELTDKELEDHIKTERAYLRKWLIDVLETKWYYRETGDEAEIDAGFIPGTPLSQQDLLKKIKKGSTYSRAEMEAMIDYFLGDRSDYYKKEEQ